MADETENQTVGHANANPAEQAAAAPDELKEDALETVSGGLGDTATHEVGHRKRG